MREKLNKSSIYSRVLIFIGFLTMFPIVVLPFYPDEYEHRFLVSFMLPSVVMVVFGLILALFVKPKVNNSLEWQNSQQRGSIPVIFAWIVGFFAGAIPLYMGGQLDFVKAVFESVSGWTTTGTSVVADVEAMPHVYLFHRSFMQYCGGLGFILMMLLLFQGKQAMLLYGAEGHPDLLTPNVKSTAQRIFIIYNSFLVAAVTAYRIFGMKIFDGLCHSMSALSTAGFSTKNASIGEYNSFPIEIITIVLMFVGATNFAVLMLFVKLEFKKIFKISEVKFMLRMLIIFIPIVTISVLPRYGKDLFKAFHEGLFAIVSIFSTTGFSTDNYYDYPAITVALFLLLMLLGGCIGSTAGGIKLTRAYLLIKITKESIRKRFSSPRRVYAVNYSKLQGKTEIDNDIVLDTLSFITTYMGIAIVGILLTILTAGCTLQEGLFDFVSSLGNIGVSSGIVNSTTNNATLIVQMVGMTLGRLEIFIVFMGIYNIILKATGGAKKLINN